MRFALSGLASLTLHGALLGAVLGVAWRGPPADRPRIEVEIVFGEPLAAPRPTEAENVEPPLAAASAKEEDIPRAEPDAPRIGPPPRVKRPAMPLRVEQQPLPPAFGESPITPTPSLPHPGGRRFDEVPFPLVGEGEGGGCAGQFRCQVSDSPPVATGEPSGREEQAASGADRMDVALSALPWQPSERPRPNAPPSYGGNPAPAYPAQARRRGIQGQVVVRAEVGADGRAARVEVMRSSGHALLDAAALASVREWRFAPAEIDGVLSAGAIEVPITFKLVD